MDRCELDPEVGGITSELRDQPVFICGHPKSGTTLLLALLDSHPQLVVYPYETFFFRGLLPEIRKLSPPEKASLASRYLLQFIEWDNDRSRSAGTTMDLSPDERTYVAYARMCKALQQRVQDQPMRHDGDLLSAAILSYGEVYGHLHENTSRWVEKTTYNERFATQVFKWWPQARCLHVVRDPRDNYASYRRKHPSLTPENFSRNWRESAADGARNQDRYGLHRYRVVRFEDLVQEPEQTIAVLKTFLEIRDDEVLHIPTRNGRPWRGNSMFADQFNGISAKPVGRWQQKLDPFDAQIIEILSRPWMEKHGYPRQSGTSGQAYAHIIGSQLRRGIARVRNWSRSLGNADDLAL